MKQISELKEDYLNNCLDRKDLEEYTSRLISDVIAFGKSLIPFDVEVIIEEENFVVNGKYVNGSNEYNTRTGESTIIIYREAFISRVSTFLEEPLSPDSIHQFIMASILYTYLHENGHVFETRVREDYAKKAIYFLQGIGLSSIIDLCEIKSYKELIRNESFLDFLIESRKYVIDAELFADKFVIDTLKEHGLDAYIDYYNQIPEFNKTDSYYEIYSLGITDYIAQQIAKYHFYEEKLDENDVFEEIYEKAIVIESKLKKEVRI